jgi:hypothetical protein
MSDFKRLIERPRAALKFLEGGRDILGSSNFKRRSFEPKSACCCLSLAHVKDVGIIGLGQERQLTKTGDDLA